MRADALSADELCETTVVRPTTENNDIPLNETTLRLLRSSELASII